MRGLAFWEQRVTALDKENQTPFGLAQDRPSQVRGEGRFCAKTTDPATSKISAKAAAPERFPKRANADEKKFPMFKYCS
jgi:hypothetical protein